MGSELSFDGKKGPYRACSLHGVTARGAPNYRNKRFGKLLLIVVIFASFLQFFTFLLKLTFENLLLLLRPLKYLSRLIRQH